jgi:hypothetical protein
VKKFLLVFSFAYAGCSFGAASAPDEVISYKEQSRTTDLRQLDYANRIIFDHFYQKTVRGGICK